MEAAAFRLVATRLISRITGRAQHTVLGVAGDSALRMMEKAAMVEQVGFVCLCVYLYSLLCVSAHVCIVW